jgi:hypothetical protein
VWDKGVAIPKPVPSPTPSTAMGNSSGSNGGSPSPTSTPTASNFEAWSTNIDSKMLSDQAQRNFLTWVEGRANVAKNHLQLVQENTSTSRISILKKSDDLGSKIFSSYFPEGSKTIIGATENWTIDQLANNGWVTSACRDQYMPGVALCQDTFSRLGFVITSDANYSSRDPGNDGGALLAHEYFHLVQISLQKSKFGIPIKGGDKNSANALPAWLVEGTAEFVGYSVGALSQNSSYWNGRAKMLSYAPQSPMTGKNSIADYEIRTCCGNDTPTYPYNIGLVATEYIVASIGFQKMLDIFVDFGTSKDFEKSFEKITGISKTEFYEKFDEIRTKVGLPAISWKLVCLTNTLISEIPKILPTCNNSSTGNNPTGNNPTPSPSPTPVYTPPPVVDRNSNLDGQGCQRGETDVTNTFGRFICTTLPNGNNLWKKSN